MLLFRDDFCKAFDSLLTKTGISGYQISQYTNLDGAYLSRLRRGRKNNPSVETIMKISLALAHLSDDIALHDIEGLFNAVGRSIKSK
jgi:transcriptional regulator with XRE-family HTH domain